MFFIQYLKSEIIHLGLGDKKNRRDRISREESVNNMMLERVDDTEQTGIATCPMHFVNAGAGNPLNFTCLVNC